MYDFYDLPTEVVVGGETYRIRSDFRAVLDIITALSDRELTEQDKVVVILSIFYLDVNSIPPHLIQEALNECMRFVNLGKNEEEKKDEKKQPKLMDWKQDFPYIIAPINKAAGRDVRALEYMHWWTFVGYYNEIGDGMFSNIVSIRKKLKLGKKLDKADREFYRNNKDIIDFHTQYTEQESTLLKEWGAM